MFDNHNIFVFDDIISDELCDECIDLIDKYATQDESEFVVRTNVKAKGFSVQTCGLIDIKIRKDINEKLYNVMSKLIESISLKVDISVTSDAGFQFRKIHGETNLHTDGVCHSCSDKSTENAKLRQMAVIIALNSDYDGGEFYFPIQDITIKLKKGQIITFPPFWTHPHLVRSPENNTFRYTINTWLCGLG